MSDPDPSMCDGLGGLPEVVGQGSQYFAKTYQRLLQRLEIRQSTSRTGSCLDNAAAESFFATIKSEIGTKSWPDKASA